MKTDISEKKGQKMKNLNALQYFLVIILFTNLYAGDWRWIEIPEKFNPSGIEIDTLNYEFQFIDWNGDSLVDLIIDQHGQLEYYERQKTAALKWQKKNLPLPCFEKFCFTAYPEFDWEKSFFFPNFAIGDLDNDGDWDIVTDSLHFFENIGTNSQPVWQKDPHYFDFAIDSVIAVCDSAHHWQSGTDSVKLFPRFHPRLLDFNHDGKIDFLLDDCLAMHQSGWFFKHLTNRTHLFLNESSGDTLHWKLADALLDKLLGRNGNIRPYENFWDVNISFCDVDNDSDWDVIAHSFPQSFTGIDDPPCWSYYFSIWENKETNFNQQLIELYGVCFPQLLMHYQILDFDQDGNQDFIVTTPRRQLKWVENKSNEGCFEFVKDNPGFGRLNVERNAFPFFYQQTDSSNQLIVSEDYLDFGQTIWVGPVTQGRLRDFGEWNHLRQNLDSINYWIDFEQHEFYFTGEYYINFYDYDKDGDDDFALSYWWGSKFFVKFYRNDGTTQTPIWERDSIFLNFFDDKNFKKPYFIDVDNDGLAELFIKKGIAFTCYQNYGTNSNPDWREENKFLDGISDLEKFHLASADLDGDGDEDLIFGEYDGTLSFYENLGAHSNPRWRYLPEVFQNIDVGRNAAPAFADVDGDGDYDLVVGNEKGFLYFFRNESTVSVKEEKTQSRIVNNFALGQNYPNPFNSSTSICYHLANKCHIALEILNLNGQLVKRLAKGEKSAGNHSIRWDGKDERGREMASGIYLCRLKAKDFCCTKKLLLIR